MGNLSALVFVLLSFVFPTLSSHYRRNRMALYACWFTLAAHHAVAFVNAFITPVTSGWGDLYMFHNMGAGIVNVQAGYQPYGEFLKVLYQIFGISFWLGEVTSILVYSLSLLALAELAARLGLEKSLTSIVLFFGLPAGALVHRSVTMREVYQSTGLLFAILALVRIRQGKLTASSLVMLSVSSASMVFLHQSLGLFVLIIWVFALPWSLKGVGSLGSTLGLIALFSAPIVLPSLTGVLASDSATVRAFEDGRLLQYAANYREHVNEARSDYGMSIDSSSILDFAATSTVVVALYFLAPMPWQMGSPIDVIACTENFLRLALFFGAYRLYRDSDNERRSTAMMVFLLAMLLECMWALGTTNWGTAMRHHVPSHGIFVLLGVPYLARFWRDSAMESLLQRRARRRALQAATLERRKDSDE